MCKPRRKVTEKNNVCLKVPRYNNRFWHQGVRQEARSRCELANKYFCTVSIPTRRRSKSDQKSINRMLSVVQVFRKRSAAELLPGLGFRLHGQHTGKFQESSCHAMRVNCCLSKARRQAAESRTHAILSCTHVRTCDCIAG